MRTNRLWRYMVGLSPRLSETVLEENDTRFSIDVSTTRSRRYLLLTSASETTTAVRFLSAAEPQGAANCRVQRCNCLRVAAAPRVKGGLPYPTLN